MPSCRVAREENVDGGSGNPGRGGWLGLGLGTEGLPCSQNKEFSQVSSKDTERTEESSGWFSHPTAKCLGQPGSLLRQGWGKPRLAEGPASDQGWGVQLVHCSVRRPVPAAGQDAETESNSITAGHPGKEAAEVGAAPECRQQQRVHVPQGHPESRLVASGWDASLLVPGYT